MGYYGAKEGQSAMKKVLLIATTRLTMDGLTEILLRVARIAAREYLVGFALGEGCSADIQPQLEAIGSVYQLPSRKKKLPCYMAALAALVKKKGYEVVHIHGNSATMAFDLLAVWAGGATVRITHCHNCAHQPALKQAPLGRLLNRLVTDPVACSRAAGEMLYTRPFRVLVNGIDCERFSFSPSVREQMRAKLGLQDCFVVGHIGRFSQQKNHTRLFRIFKTVLQQKPQARLLLCGQGENFEQSQQEAKALGIAEMVLFCGNVNRPEDYLQAMDVFVMTSLFEGLPIVGVEAQASGLPCIFADTITQEVKILPQTQFLALTQPDEAWAERIVQTKPMERSLAGHCVESAGFAEENLDRQVCALYGMEEHHFANISGRDHL